MRRAVTVTVLAFAVLALVAVAIVGRRRGPAADPARAAHVAAIRAVLDTAATGGWIETFETRAVRALGDHDPRWRTIFGRVLVDPARGAVGHPGSQDGGDDYAFRAVDVPSGSVEITVDGWWDEDGAIGAEGAVQLAPPHRLYEATLWRGRLTLIYFYGPGPSDFEILAESAGTAPGSGHYRIVFRLERHEEGWNLDAWLLDAAGSRIAAVAARDGRLGSGGQGIGLLAGSRAGYISGIAVRPLQ